MKSLCITGLIQKDIDLIEKVLEQSGMSLAKPATRDNHVSIAYWHDQVLKLPIVHYTEMSHVDDDQSFAKLNTGSAQLSSNPWSIGRLWEQLASDIFISNLESEVWGWADTRSAAVLPFWKHFDPQTRFILVATRPERFIAHLIESSNEHLDHQAELARWEQFHRSLLRFHQENPNTSVLVDFEDCVSQSAALTKTCKTKFDLGLTPKHFSNVVNHEISDIARFLAFEVCSSHPGHQSFALDLQASVTPIGFLRESFRVPSPTELITRYRSLKAQVESLTDTSINQSQNQSAEISKLQGQLETIISQHNELIAQQTEEHQQFLTLNSQHQQLTSQHQQLTEKDKSTQEENDLLLAQLHQVQEELESYFVKHKEISEQFEQLKKQPKPLETKPEHEKQIAAQTESIKKLQLELDHAKKDVVAIKKEQEQALAKHKESTDVINKELLAFKSQHQQLTSQNQQLTEKEKDTQEENDLLLAQLHQVQEELENYFLKYQDADAKLQSLETRLIKLSARHADDTFVDKIEILSIDDVLLAEKYPNENSIVEWKITGLELGLKRYDEIRFGSFIEAGVACLTFSRDSGRTALNTEVSNGALSRWPGAEDEDMVVISTVGDETTGPQRAQALKSLSATDWQLVKTLVALLAKELLKPEVLHILEALKAPPNTRSKQGGKQHVLNVKAQAEAFAALQKEFKQLPLLLHFDGLRLGLSQEESEYEYLTFVFDKCYVGDKLVPEFEFRFASVNLPVGSFGSNPRLQFHETRSKAVFDNWFEESKDDFGPKLELRFAQPNAMDLNVWQRMTPGDQSLVTALIMQLPVFIEHIKTDTKKTDTKTIFRSWSDWLRLAEDVHNTLLLNLKTEVVEQKPSVAKPVVLKKSVRKAPSRVPSQTQSKK